MRPIFLILALALALRLVHVNAPILGVHSWRQADTAAMARNFHEQGYRLFSPQIDWGGASAGYVECEFPAFPYTVALLYGVFGASEFWGRLLAALLSTLTVYFLYRLTRVCADERTAMWSAALFAVLPLSVFYGRAFMPEAAMLCFSVLGIYAFERWLETRADAWYLISAVSVALACLLKIPCLYLGLPLLYLAWRAHGGRLWRQGRLWLFAALVLAPVALWYLHAHETHRRFGISFGIWGYGSDKWGNWSLLATPDFWNWILLRSLAERHLTWAGLPLVLVGLAMPRRGPKEGLFDAWLAALLVYLVVVARGSYVHEYYQLPFLLPLSVVMGRAAAAGFRSWPTWDRASIATALLLAGVVLLSEGRLLSYWSREDPNSSPHYRLARRIQETTPRTARIIALDDGDPTLLYLAHRKGWHASAGSITPDALMDRAQEGASYFVGLRRDLSPGFGPLTNLERQGRGTVRLDDCEGFIFEMSASPDPRRGGVPAPGTPGG